MDEIIIRGLRVLARVGVPDAERTEPQQLEIHLVIQPQHSFVSMDDNISFTVDYDSVAQRVTSIAAERPRRLIETLASEIAQTILKEFSARKVTVEVRKFILTQTDYVAAKYDAVTAS